MNTLETVLKAVTGAKVIDETAYVPIDLSVFNKALLAIDVADAGIFENYIESHLAAHQAKVAFGGYNEQRNLYQSSAIFNDGETDERNIHIGMDLWVKAGTPVLAALEGKVHSFDYNAGMGNYGPTIILEHQIENQQFYTLYGHLSLESIEEIEIGDVFQKGQKLGTLGDDSINGGYAPHLHFQIIKNIQGYFGDYPGVCNSNQLEFYLENCPDPELLLKLKKTL